jgi:phosphoglucosamine mutase
VQRVEFGADGIRGVAGEWPVVPPVMVRMGQALGRHVQQQSEHPFVVVGRDTRPSGAELLSCLTAGLADQGIDAINLGVMTTPGVAFITRQQKADLGVIVSASHSPLQYNGIKLVKQNGLRLQREDEIEIEALIDEYLANAGPVISPSGQQTDGQNLVELYVQDHVRRCPARSLEGFKVILDCADGAAARVAPEAFSRLGADVVVINDAITGKGINYQCGSEYMRKNPRELTETIQQHNAAYGFSLDGDGDRLVVVDSDGRVFDGDDLLFVLALYFHAQGFLRGNSVVTCHLANQGLGEALAEVGIRTVYTGNGDKNLEAAMWEGDYLLGGEPGGNIIINDGYHTAADAVYTALVLSGVLVHGHGTDLAEMAAPLRKRPQEIISVRLRSMPTYEHSAALRQEFKRMQTELGKGSRILEWVASTEPGVFRILVEGSRESTQDQVSTSAQFLQQLVQKAANSWA